MATINGTAGNDSLFSPSGDDFISGFEGNDTVRLSPDSDTVIAGSGNDSVLLPALGRPLVFLNEGNDTYFGINGQAATVAGGNDSADGNDSIFTGPGPDLIFGNGGADTLRGGDGDDIIVGGFGGDLIFGDTGADILLANQDNDTIVGNISLTDPAGDTVVGGFGNDSIVGTNVRDVIIGSEGNDTIRGGLGEDTVTGGSGADFFDYRDFNDDGNRANGSAPVEFVNGVNFDEDHFLVGASIAFAAFVSAGAPTTLDAAASNAIAAVAASGGGGPVAAVFNFNNRTYLAVDSHGDGQFTDSVETLLDISGATGTIDASDFLP